MQQTNERPVGFFNAVEKLRVLNRPFAIATVIAVRGSASAKPGSKALIDENGRNVWGWVGGGCAESFVVKNAVEAMGEGLTRIVEADLDDEIFGLGMPCGGVMDVYIEPQKPVEKITISEAAEISEAALHLARWMGFEPKFSEGSSQVRGTKLERCLYAIAHAISDARETSFSPLKRVRGMTPQIHAWPEAPLSELLIVGSSRITEALAQLATMLRWNVRAYGWNLDRANYPASVAIVESNAGFSNFEVIEGSAVIVASHHKGDLEFIQTSMTSGASYVGMVASPKRAGLVFEHLTEQKMAATELGKVFAPAGLEMHCNGPQEIALSILAEIIWLKGESPDVKN